MEDFRKSPQYKIFTTCRTSNEKYDAALAAFERSDAKDMSAAKRASIEAMAYNESCLLSAKKVPVQNSENTLKEYGLSALKSYIVRENLQNQVLTNIIRNQTTAIVSETMEYLKSASVETARFSRLEAFIESGHSEGASGWLYAMIIVIGLLAIRGYRKIPKAIDGTTIKTPGVIRQSIGFFGSVYQGLKSEYTTLHKAMKSKKDNDNV